MFGSLGKEPGSVYQCTNNDDVLLEQFCLTKTELKLNETHLLLRIRRTNVSDSGNYTVEWVFNRLESNDKEEIQLGVIKGKQICTYRDTTVPETVIRWFIVCLIFLRPRQTSAQSMKKLIQLKFHLSLKKYIGEHCHLFVNLSFK